METRKISIVNLASQEDAEKVKQVLRDVWGIRGVDINVDKREAIVSFDAKAASFIDFQQAIADCGYQLENPEGDIKQDEF
ncbi:heavy-metal-associated domain-containing protein [Desertibacillus haloalkaliphilus]|uniref:heavy-metal-associated domain-containing protein n=1 Tax=Desertibacillus haloalkaliphilus TaxID=1328930 RepID=UPI001C25AC35|nr:heavy metal-associated domain-containing protein [Desertibacillus haloalkaliphilus]MBU8908679.1 heavy-metal-associated domain-containing protein [Desertibacillus haloalkaliphilus]